MLQVRLEDGDSICDVLILISVPIQQKSRVINFLCLLWNCAMIVKEGEKASMFDVCVEVMNYTSLTTDLINFRYN